MSVMKFIALLLAFEFDSGPLPGHAGHAGRSCKPPSAGLQPLPTLATTDLHLVADDWSGTGDWTSRSGGYTATVSGTPTKAATTQFPGRSEISGFASAVGFRLAGTTAHCIRAGDTITYEAIVKTPGTVSVVQSWVGWLTATATQIFNMNTLNNVNGSFESILYNTAIANYLGGTLGAGSYQMPSRYNLMTVVVDIATPRYEVYVNGVSLLTDTTVGAGSLANEAVIVGIGGLWRADFSALDQVWTGTIMEIMRHREALDDATVASRAAAFNAAKGY